MKSLSKKQLDWSISSFFWSLPEVVGVGVRPEILKVGPFRPSGRVGVPSLRRWSWRVTAHPFFAILELLSCHRPLIATARRLEPYGHAERSEAFRRGFLCSARGVTTRNGIRRQLRNSHKPNLKEVFIWKDKKLLLTNVNMSEQGLCVSRK